jgi:hypothetical protein
MASQSEIPLAKDVRRSAPREGGLSEAPKRNPTMQSDPPRDTVVIRAKSFSFS